MYLLQLIRKTHFISQIVFLGWVKGVTLSICTLTEFDGWLAEFMKKMGPEDLVMITADHGCDPAYLATTDHTREYIPLLILGRQVKPGNLGIRPRFADIAATVCDVFGLPLETEGESFKAEIL